MMSKIYSNITESQLRDKVNKYLNTLEGQGKVFYFKLVEGACQRGGLPDFLVCYQGRFYGLELKKPVDSYGLQGRQNVILKKIAKAGGLSYVIESLDQLKQIIK